ncbi:hypothetical protein PYR66_10015 [Klebsiella aerogenes]|nr:hypothetical protein PYR66_10015 [Klebsiella aerogenes]
MICVTRENKDKRFQYKDIPPKINEGEYSYFSVDENNIIYVSSKALSLQEEIAQRNNKASFEAFNSDKATFSPMPTKELLIIKRDSGEITHAEYEKIYRKLFDGNSITREDLKKSRERRAKEALKADTREAQFWIAMIAELAPNNTKSVDELIEHLDLPKPPKPDNKRKYVKNNIDEFKPTVRGVNIVKKGNLFCVIKNIKLCVNKFTTNYCGGFETREEAEQKARELRIENGLPEVPKTRAKRNRK